MYNVLLILLHRPFVAGGHLWHNARSVAVNSLLVCVTAATKIVDLLKLYHQAFSIQRAPYLISYATYVSATIHVRIAAQRTLGSKAHKSLATCLEVFRLNQGTNSATARANTIIESLMNKLNVDISGIDHNLEVPQSPENLYHGSTTVPRATDVASSYGGNLGFSPGLDVDAVIQSFAPPRAREDSSRRDRDRNFQPNGNDTQARTDDAAQSQQVEIGNGRSEVPMSSSGEYQGEGYQAYSQETLNNPDVWMQNWQFSAYPTDDVLFGFDGSAIDGFYMTDVF